MEEIKNIDNIDNNDNNTTDKKRKYVFTEKRQAAFDKMKEARRQQIAEKRTRTLEKPELKRTTDVETIKEKENERIRMLFDESSSSGTDSSNYESDHESKKIIISNYDTNEPDSKIKITKIKRKNTLALASRTINNEQLKKIYDEVKLENSDDEQPVKKTRKQSEPKQIKQTRKRVTKQPEQQSEPKPVKQTRKRVAKQQQPEQQSEPKIIYI